MSIVYGYTRNNEFIRLINRKTIYRYLNLGRVKIYSKNKSVKYLVNGLRHGKIKEENSNFYWEGGTLF